MTFINDLDSQVLYRILRLASGEQVDYIDEWKEKLTLLQVCTKWYDLLKRYVFSQGFIVINSLEDSEDSDSDISNTCVYYADNDIVCRSNLGIITERDKYNCDCVSELAVRVFDYNLHISRYAHVLKRILKLGVGYWLNMTTLKFFSALRFPLSLETAQPNLEELAVSASQYIHDLQNRLPNVKKLDVFIQDDEVLLTSFLILINHYAQHLQHLNLDHQTGPQKLPLFSTELTSLSLSLGNFIHQDSSLYAKPLQWLQLSNIPSSIFSWWIFHDFTTPGYIEFTNLKLLYLSYKEQTDKEKKLSERYTKQTKQFGTHMLRFPKLKYLTLHNPPVDCDVLYTDTIPIYLETLNILGNCSSIVAASRLRFTDINRMEIVVYDEEAPSNDFHIAADRYFGYTEIGSACKAIFRTPIDMQRTVSWVNVTTLKLYDIAFDELLKHIPNLYNLQNLKIVVVHLSDESLAIIRSGLEEEKQDKYELLDTKRVYFLG